MKPSAKTILSWAGSVARFRRTVRARLTVIYGSIFLASGAAVLTVAYLLVRHFADVLSGGVSETVQLKAGPRHGGGRCRRQYGAARAPPGNVTGSVADGAPKTGPRLIGGQPVNSHAQHQIEQLRNELLRQVGIQHNAVLHSLLVWSIVALVVAVLISGIVGWLIAGRALRPLRSISSATRSISARNLHERLAYAGPADEVKELADTIDRLLERLEGAFEAQRRFVANASHELRTPLARQRVLAEVAIGDRGATVESLRAAHERVIAAGEQQERLIGSLLTLARSDRGLDHRETVDVAELFRGALGHRQADVGRLALAVTESLGSATASGDANLLERLATNLVDNAVEHNVHEGWIELSTSNNGEDTLIRVANSGPVVPDDELARLLQPFQRMGRDRTGTADHHGLGLAIVQAIVSAHDGRLSLRPQAGGGLVVELTLPAATAQLAGGEARLADMDAPPAAVTVTC